MTLTRLAELAYRVAVAASVIGGLSSVAALSLHIAVHRRDSQ
jgi:hypothetical protein